MNIELKGRTALITGASSGIGTEIARDLAKKGANIVLVSRRKEVLEKLESELRKECGVEVYVMDTDLANADARQNLFNKIEQANINVDILVNNAGFGLFGKFVDLDWHRVNEMLQVNITALTHLTYLFTPAMVKRGWGRILLIASTAGYQPVPLLGTYGATKSYVINFGGSLNYELKGTGVTCTTVSPGDTATEFYDVSDQPQTAEQMKYFFSSEEVALISTEALLACRPTAVTGNWNSFLAWGARLIPDSWSAAVAYRIVTGKLNPLARLNKI